MASGFLCTLRRAYGEGAGVAGLLDDVDNVLVVHAHDVHVVDGEDAVSDVQLATPLCWAALDYPTCDVQN